MILVSVLVLALVLSSVWAVWKAHEEQKAARQRITLQRIMQAQHPTIRPFSQPAKKGFAQPTRKEIA